MSLHLEALVDAIVAGDNDAVSRLLAVDPALANATWDTDRLIGALTHYMYGGDTALHAIAAAYRAALVPELLARGADVRARNRRGAEPLHYAADGYQDSPLWNPSAQAATIEALVTAGADPNALDKSGVAPLHRAVRTRCAAAVAALLDAGADPHLPNKSGSVALDLATRTTGRGGSGKPAAKEQQEEIVRVLSQYGAGS